MLLRSAQALSASNKIDEMIIVAAPEEAAEVRRILSQDGTLKPWQVVAGGSERQYSIANALKALPAGTDYVAVHDAARPLVLPESVTAVVEAAQRQRAAGLAVPVKDTIKVVGADGFVTATPARQTLMAVQTPQVFDARLYAAAAAAVTDENVTDDCGVFEAFGRPVRLVAGEYANLKVTTPEDLPGAARKGTAMRIGHGYDVHRLVEGRKLILGGVEIPWEKGLLGHSDADVLTHAVMDALLGAAALGDIGQHFPDKDPQWEGADSLMLLRRVAALLASAGWRIGNIDATILCQRPKLAPHIAQMRARLAAAAGIAPEAVSVKATTEEGLGFTGSGEGIAAHAVCLLEPLGRV